MRLTNHKSEKFYHLSDGTTIRGTITMTSKEWSVVFELLKLRYEQAEKEKETYTRDGLRKIAHSALHIPQKKDPFSVGIVATRIIAYAFGLKNYRERNYAINIVG